MLSNLLFQWFTVRLNRAYQHNTFAKSCCVGLLHYQRQEALNSSTVSKPYFSLLSRKEAFFSSRVILLLSILAWLARVFDCQIKNAIFPRNSICPGSEKKIASSRDYFYFHGRKYIFAATVTLCWSILSYKIFLHLGNF